MKRLVLAGVLLTTLVAASPAFAESPMSVNFGFVPLGIGMVQNQDGFSAEKGGRTDEINSQSLYSPSMFWGMDFKTPMGGFGFDLVGASLMHGAYHGTVGGVEFAFILPHPEGSRMSQRIKYGYLTGSLNWQADHTDVKFDDATGWQAGYAMDLGRTAQFHFEILYRNLVFDVIGGDPTSDDKLDLSGVVMNLGIRFDIDMGIGAYY
jgi:hypothetical protein